MTKKILFAFACAISLAGCEAIYLIDTLKDEGSDAPHPVVIEIPDFVDDEVTAEPLPPVRDIGFFINWVAPSEREDGTVLLLSEISHYTLYYGRVKHEYSILVDNIEPSLTKLDISSLFSGKRWLAMTTTDVDGRESSYSIPVRVRLP